MITIQFAIGFLAGTMFIRIINKLDNTTLDDIYCIGYNDGLDKEHGEDYLYNSKNQEKLEKEYEF